MTKMKKKRAVKREHFKVVVLENEKHDNIFGPYAMVWKGKLKMLHIE